MGRLIRAMDWSTSPLGPVESWHSVLRASVGSCLGSPLPMSVVWGPARAQIYNDGYRGLSGIDHPRSLGQDFRECWASSWDRLGAPFARALEGRADTLENQRVFLQREGSAEESFFTFILSPIRDEQGSVVGLLHQLIETTRLELSERRARALDALAARTSVARSTSEALALAADTFAEHHFDVPFIAFYAPSEDAAEVTYLAGSGNLEGSSGRPSTRRVRAASAISSLLSALGSAEAIVVEDIEQRLGIAASGPYPEPTRTALVMAITPHGSAQVEIVMVAGVSPRLPLNAAYRRFYDRLARIITGAVTSARARELMEGKVSADHHRGERQRPEEAMRELRKEIAALNVRLQGTVAERRSAETALLRQLATAQEDERRRVARDLHDSIGQLVTGLSLSLKATGMSGDLPPGSVSAARLAEAQRVADALGREVHRLAVQLRPTSLDELGLEAAVQDLVQAWSSRTGVRAECAMTLGRTRLTHDIETTLYRVVQEGLTNVAKHARATVVSVVFTRVDGYVTAVVEDDGVGFDPEALSQGRLGLVGMRERAGLVCGEVDIESKPGWGTTVLVRIPIPVDRLDDAGRQR